MKAVPLEELDGAWLFSNNILSYQPPQPQSRSADRGQLWNSSAMYSLLVRRKCLMLEVRITSSFTKTKWYMSDHCNPLATLVPQVEGWSGASCPLWTTYIPLHLGRCPSRRTSVISSYPSSTSSTMAPVYDCPSLHLLPGHRHPTQLHDSASAHLRKHWSRKCCPGSEAEPRGWLNLDYKDKTPNTSGLNRQK